MGDTKGIKRKAFGDITNVAIYIPDEKKSELNSIVPQIPEESKDVDSTGLKDGMYEAADPIQEEQDNTVTSSGCPIDLIDSILNDSLCALPIDEAFKKFEFNPRELKLYQVPEYTKEILDTLKEAELKIRPRYNYFLKQTDISEMMRSILVSWIVEVQIEYRFQTQTLYLAVNYLDRFLSMIRVKRAKLQLIGTIALFIATKYEVSLAKFHSGYDNSNIILNSRKSASQTSMNFAI